MARFPNSILKKVPYHKNGTAAVTAAPVDCTQGGDGLTFATSFYLNNPDATNSVLVSFDGGTSFITVKAGTNLNVPYGYFKTVYIKSSAATPAYEILLLADR